MDLYTIRNKLNMGEPLTNLNLKVTIYARVSTDHLEQKKSLQNQIEHFYEYIKQNKNWTYIEGYIDEGITGTSDIKRDNFMKMINDAKNKKFDLIITKEISRFSRNTLDSIKYTRLLLSYGVFVLFVNDNINTALPDSELRLTIMASMAQDEIRRLSERVKFGMNRAILRGEILGNNTLYGYTKDKTTNKLIIIPEEANIIRKIYKLYALDNSSLSQISKYLNNHNITTREGNTWSVTTLSRMVQNPKYKGYYCGKKSEVIDYITKQVKPLNKDKWIIYKDTNKIPPIITTYLWNKANLKLTTNKKTKTTNNKYLYSGKIFCELDNHPFNRRIFRKQNKDITWICSNYLKNGKNICNSPNIRESELTTILKDLIIKKLNLDLSKLPNILLTEYNKHTTPTTKEEIKKLTQEKNLIYKKKDKLLDLNIKGNINDNELLTRNNLYNQKLNLIEQELTKIVNNKDISTKDLEIYITNYSTTNNFIEKIINIILNKIIVSKTNNTINLKIYLNLSNNISSNIYTFKRGYDTKCTKRYTIIYKVEYY